MKHRKSVKEVIESMGLCWDVVFEKVGMAYDKSNVSIMSAGSAGLKVDCMRLRVLSESFAILLCPDDLWIREEPIDRERVERLERDTTKIAHAVSSILLVIVQECWGMSESWVEKQVAAYVAFLQQDDEKRGGDDGEEA